MLKSTGLVLSPWGVPIWFIFYLHKALQTQQLFSTIGELDDSNETSTEVDDKIKLLISTTERTTVGIYD